MKWYISKKAVFNERNVFFTNRRLSLKHCLCFMVNKVNVSQFVGGCLRHEMSIRLEGKSLKQPDEECQKLSAEQFTAKICASVNEL